MRHYKATFTTSDIDIYTTANNEDEAKSDAIHFIAQSGFKENWKEASAYYDENGGEIVRITPLNYIQSSENKDTHVLVNEDCRQVRIFDGIAWHCLDADAVSDEDDGYVEATEPEGENWKEATLDDAMDKLDEWHGRNDISGWDTLEHHLNR